MDEVDTDLSGSYSRFRSHTSGRRMLVGGDTHTWCPAGIVKPSTFCWLEERYQLATSLDWENTAIKNVDAPQFLPDIWRVQMSQFYFTYLQNIFIELCQVN